VEQDARRAAEGAELLRNALRTGSDEVLRSALSALVEAAAGPDPWPSTLANLGAAWRTAYRWGLEPDGLEQGIRVLRRAVEITPTGDAAGPSRMANLGVLLRDDYDREPRAGTLDEAIGLLSAAVSDSRATAGQRAEWAGNLAIALLSRYEREHRRDDLDVAVRLGRLAADPGARRGADSLAAAWNNLSGLLSATFAEDGEIDCLDEAVDAAERAVTHLPDGHRMRGHYLVTVGQLRTLRYDTTGAIGDRRRALEVLGEAVEECPAGASWFARAHTAFAAALVRGAYTAGGEDSLVAAIDHHRVALEATPSSSAGFAGRAANLGTVLVEHFLRTGERAGLDAAIRLHEAAATAAVDDLAERVAVLSSYAECLLIRFQTGDARSQGGDARSQGGDARSQGGEVRFRAGDAAGDAALAVRVAREAAAPAARDGRASVTARIVLARVLRAVSLRDGGTAGLDEAVDLLRAVLAAGRARAAGAELAALEELGSALRLRFDRLGDREDLDESIAAGYRLLDLLAPDDVRRVDGLSRLSLVLRRRAGLDRSPAASDEMIEVCRAALAAVPAGAPAMRGTLEANLGSALRERAEMATARSAADLSALRERAEMAASESAADLAEAALLLTAAAERAAPDGVELAVRLCDVGTVQRQRAAQLGDPALLDDAIDVHRRALGVAVPGSRESATALHNLAGSLRDRYVLAGSETDLTEALALLRRAAATATVPAPQRLDSARTCAALAADTGRWAVAAEAYATAVRLLQVTLWHGVERSKLLDRIDDAGWIAADAAAAALRAGDVRGALRVVEAGRSLMWRQRVEADASLRAAAGDERLRARLLAAREVLDRDPDRTDPVLDADLAGLVHADVAEGARRHRREQRLAAARAWDEAARPVFRRRRTARGPRSGTIVVIITSRHGCWAVLRSRHATSAVELTALRLDELADVMQDYLPALDTGADPVRAQDAVAAMLTWAGRTVVAPVLRALGHDAACRHPAVTERLWWCATGPLALMPLHAAGDAPDHVVSSYTPTIAAVRGRPPARRAGPRRLLAVDSGELRHARAEIAEVTSRLAGIATIDTVDGPEATPAAVLAALRDHRLAHLVCHGDQDPERPSRAGLVLAGGRLTVDDLARARLPATTDLVYLAACQTAWTGLRLYDEALHLAAALYFTGCRQVIATLWPLSDRLGPAAAGLVYGHLARSGELRVDDSAQAVHALTVTLRRRYPSAPSLWAAFVHYGR
jgi:hypothetical protein